MTESLTAAQLFSF